LSAYFSYVDERNLRYGETDDGLRYSIGAAGTAVEFRILGPLEVINDSEHLELHGARQHIVVAMLSLSANRPVTMNRLLEAVYGEDLPPTARSQVQISISSLRKLFASCGQDAVISTHAGSYAIRVGARELDAERFTELLAGAREARDTGNLDLAVARYRDAARLWRGPALDGIDSQLVRSAASRLDEARISSSEDRITLELELGRHHELVSELTELVEEYPLREALRNQLMLALYRCDRMAEALQVYRDTRRTMIEELGIEPGERLHQLEYAILTADPALDLPPRPATIRPDREHIPSLMPADIADFTGREEQVARIARHLVGTSEQQVRLAVPVILVVGKGGVGKTTLAVHAAHTVSDHFADGRLYADLHGAGSHPVSPTQVLERFIRAFGVPGTQIPDGVDERAEMYRNLLADRRILVVLDDAASESQVTPLLPGSASAGVIVTSRNRLTGIAGVIPVEVDVFAAEKSVDLLGRIAGVARVRSQSVAAAAVAAHCGHLPLALRIAGARLAARPHWGVQHLADRLTSEANRLDELRHGEMGIRPSISLTYDSTNECARRLFRRLALLDMPVFSGWLSGALLDIPVADAEELLDDLVNAQLIDVERAGAGAGLDSQYRFHDLIRVFARERLAAEEPVAERQAALKRALGALLFLSEAARSSYYGGDYARLESNAPRWPLPARLVEHLVSDPLSWYDRERGALVAGVRQAAQAGFVELCWTLASSAVPLFESRVYLDDWRTTHDIALSAVRKANHVRGEAAMLYHLGSLHTTLLRFDQASAELAMAAQIFQEVGDDRGFAHATFHLASIDRLSGRLDEATSRYQQALAIFRTSADDVATASVLHGLAQVKLERNEAGAAMELLSEALRLCQTTGYPRLEAQVMLRLGEACLLTEQPGHAAGTFERVLAIATEIGDVIGASYALQGVGVAATRQGDFDRARDALKRAAQLADSVGERMAEARAQIGMSELELVSGNARQAALLAQHSSSVFERMNAPLYQARALSLLSDAHAAMGDAGAAAAAAMEAAALRLKLGSEDPAG
jgi:DNA-binding SARP family transcriptional activator/tetratricopeptide (TPR) repeat protein